MRILQLPSWFAIYPNDKDGVLFKNLATSLVERGINTEILSINLDSRNINKKLKASPLQLKYYFENNTPIYRFNGFYPPKRSKFLFEYWGKMALLIFKKYLAISEKPDLIHAHSYFAGFIAKSIFEKYRIPYIITEHTRLPNEAWKLRLIKEVYNKARFCTAVSSILKDKIEHLSNASVIHIPNFIQTKLFQIGSINSKDVHFLSIGRPAYIKGIDLLIKAFANLINTGRTNVSLRIGDDHSKEKNILKLINSFKLETKIELIGSLTHQQVAEQMSEANIYISSSRVETFGRSILEALAAGLPIIVTDTYGPKDYFKKDLGLMIKKNDIDELTNSMIWMYENFKKYKREELRKYVLDNFSPNNILPQYINLYSNAL